MGLLGLPLAVLAGLSWASSCEVEAAVQTLRERGDRAAYDCVISADEAINPLMDAWDELSAGDGPAGDGPAGEGRDRISRAMALWLLQHVDGAFNPMIVARLNAPDRRLLADGVHARRGRASPAPEHARVFEQLGWYRPLAAYTDARLTAEDRANISLADRPPAPPAPLAARVSDGEPAPMPIQMVIPALEPDPEPQVGWCGCGSTAGGGIGASAYILVLLGSRLGRKYR